MRKLALALAAFASLLALPACAHGGAAWPAVVRCAPQPSDVVQQVASDLLKDGVAGDLSSAVAGELERLLDQYAPEAAACLVQQAVDSLAAAVGAEPSPASMAAQARGRAYLRQRGVRRVERSQ